MSRIMGRMYDVYEIAKLLKETNIKKYTANNIKTTWESIIASKEKYKIYIPTSALEYLKKEKIKFCKGCHNFQVDFEIKEEPIIKFPSLIAKEEYKKGFAFFIGFILNNFNDDIEGDDLTCNFEYNEILPLLIEYLYSKEAGYEKDFLNKYLYLLKSSTSSFINEYKDYKNFENYKSILINSELSYKEYEILMSYSSENDIKMECAVSEALIGLASFDGVLEVIEKFKTVDEVKNIIELLFLNERNDRAGLLHEMGISSFGFKSLRKVLKKC